MYIKSFFLKNTLKIALESCNLSLIFEVFFSAKYKETEKYERLRSLDINNDRKLIKRITLNLSNEEEKLSIEKCLNKKSVIAFITDDETHNIPWELLISPLTNKPFSLSKSTPIVRHIDLDRPVRDLEIGFNKINVLIITATINDLDINEEYSSIKHYLEEDLKTENISLTRISEPTISNIQRVLARRNYHIIHFSGHSSFDEKKGGNFYLSNKKDESFILSSEKLGILLADHSSLKLAIFNSCFSALGIMNATNGLATTLVSLGVPAVIAMQDAISDKNAIIFSKSLYHSLINGLSIEEAVTEGRKSIKLNSRNTDEWYIPVLYMRSSPRNFFNKNRLDRLIWGIKGTAFNINEKNKIQPFFKKKIYFNDIESIITDEDGKYELKFRKPYKIGDIIHISIERKYGIIINPYLGKLLLKNNIVDLEIHSYNSIVFDSDILNISNILSSKLTEKLVLSNNDLGQSSNNEIFFHSDYLIDDSNLFSGDKQNRSIEISKLLINKKYQEAINLLEKKADAYKESFFEKNSNNDALMTYRSLKSIGDIYYLLGDNKNSLKIYQEIDSLWINYLSPEEITENKLCLASAAHKLAIQNLEINYSNLQRIERLYKNTIKNISDSYESEISITTWMNYATFTLLLIKELKEESEINKHYRKTILIYKNLLQKTNSVLFSSLLIRVKFNLLATYIDYIGFLIRNKPDLDNITKIINEALYYYEEISNLDETDRCFLNINFIRLILLQSTLLPESIALRNLVKILTQAESCIRLFEKNNDADNFSIMSFNLSHIYREQAIIYIDDHAYAVELLNRSLKLLKNIIKNRKAIAPEFIYDVYFTLGFTYTSFSRLYKDNELGKFINESIYFYKKALSEMDFMGTERTSKEAELYNSIGYNYIHLGDIENNNDNYEKARTYILKARKIMESNIGFWPDAAILDSLGWVEYKLGNSNKAIALIEESLNISTDRNTYIETAFHLHEIYESLGMSINAERVIFESLKKYPDTTVLKELGKNI